MSLSPARAGQVGDRVRQDRVRGLFLTQGWPEPPLCMPLAWEIVPAQFGYISLRLMERFGAILGIIEIASARSISLL
jgi:hypothetical protein